MTIRHPLPTATGCHPPTVTHRPPPTAHQAVMVSAPPLIRWKYNHVPEPGSEEERLVGVLRKPQEWAHL